MIAALDPITAELVASALVYASEEMGIAVRDAAYSPNIKERLDHSCALFDTRARLVAQAEHDPLAACVLVSPSAGLLDQVNAALEMQVPQTRHRERVAAALAGQSALVLVDDLEAGLLVLDGWAAEHVEVICRDAPAVAARVRNAGAVFVGPFSPVSLGDYLAGSNHVLPTGGTARHTGGLSVRSFLRGQYVVTATREALVAAAPHVRALAGAEDLAAHADAVNVRVGP